MIIREATHEDSEAIDKIINQPEIASMLSPTPDVRLTLASKIDDQIVFVCDGGVMLGDYMWGNTFALMAAFDKEKRGLWSVIAMRKGIRKLFTETECRDAYVTIYVSNMQAAKVCRALGISEPVRVGARRASHLTYVSWALSDKVCTELGFRFVEVNKLHHTVLQDDASSLGAFLLTASKGSIGKALEQFDTYRIIGGRHPIKAEGDDATTFTYGEAKFTIDDIKDFVEREVGNG